jgi:UDP-N-acetylmuramate--alanine ligase
MREGNAVRSAKPKIHMVGIGGTGMNSLASLLLASGWEVSGSDASATEVTENLSREGAHIRIGHRKENLIPLCNIVAYSAAIPSNNPELAAARRRGVLLLKYAQVLGLISSAKTTVAVAGTHGKTTTTAMVTSILRTAGLSTSYVLGGQAPFLGPNFCRAEKGYLVVEACEYDRSFLNLKPSFAIITNVEPEHLDCFGTFEEEQKAFSQFVELLPDAGLLAVCADCKTAVRVSDRCRGRRILCGLDSGECKISNWAPASGAYQFTLQTPEGEIGPIHLRVPGIHNMKNAALAAALTLHLGVSKDLIVSALEQFPGVERRFQILTPHSSITVISDYAHHPSEIVSVIRSCTEMFPERRVWCLFQPHQHSRTLTLFDSFAKALLLADRVVLAPIYSVREGLKEKMSVDSSDLASRINELGGCALNTETEEEIIDLFEENLQVGDVVAVMGAGDIYKTAARIAQLAKGRERLEGAVASDQG